MKSFLYLSLVSLIVSAPVWGNGMVTLDKDPAYYKTQKQVNKLPKKSLQQNQKQKQEPNYEKSYWPHDKDEYDFSAQDPSKGKGHYKPSVEEED